MPPGTPGSTRRRVARDRIQTGLSRAVLVCECEVSSGAMHTARFAVLQNRLLVVARPNRADAASWTCGGNLVLSDPNGCDPAFVFATGEAAELIRVRKPVADVVFETRAELSELLRRLSSS